MSEWQSVALGDVCDELTVGHVGSMASEYVPSGVPFLRSQNVRPGYLDLGNVKNITVDFHEHLKKSQLRAGDIVIVRTGEPGAAALIPEGLGELNCADLVIVRPGDKVDPRFLCYAINSTARQYISAHLVGAVQQHFNVKSARNMLLNLPSRRSQEAISAILGALDDKIACNHRMSRILRMLAEAKFNAAASGAGAIEQDLSSISLLVSRGVSPRYVDDPAELMVLNQKCIRGGRVDLRPSRRTVANIVPLPKMLVANDVLVNSTGVGTLGRVARWTGNQPVTVDSHVTIVRIDPRVADPICAGFAVLGLQEDIEAMGEGSTGQTELNKKRLGALKIRLPDEETSSRLRPELEAMEAMGQAFLAECDRLAELRDALLPRLMAGRICVRDSERVAEGVK